MAQQLQQLMAAMAPDAAAANPNAMAGPVPVPPPLAAALQWAMGQGGGLPPGAGAGPGGAAINGFLLQQLLHMGPLMQAQVAANAAAAAAGGGGGGGGGGAPPPRCLQLQLAPLSQHMCYMNVALVPMVAQLAMVGGPGGDEVLGLGGGGDTRVAPVLLDVRGAGYTQLKSLAITGFVDQDCK